MEEVLDVYQRPDDPRTPLVCLDELSTQLLADTRPALPPAPGHVATADYEYERCGTANVFMCYAPLEGWRHATVTERRTRLDWAHVIQDLVDVQFPDADRIVLVQDNLNTHTLGSLYEAFPAEEAHRLAAKLELHYTPKHGSWLNMAEIELSILRRQCLDRRIPSQELLAAAIAAWEVTRNSQRGTVNWRFTTADARIKLNHLYPHHES